MMTMISMPLRSTIEKSDGTGSAYRPCLRIGFRCKEDLSYGAY